MAKKAQKQEVKNTNIRTPVVAVMGHVDHGKTSLLDAIRGTRVAAKEAGGITQNTRAHEVTTDSGFKITFIDTPGHEAFSKMRERGAKVTDFVLLVVAADDGVQPQTKESIEFAKSQNVPIILAINKVDIKGINLEKIKSELSNFGVSVEEYGGEVLAFEVSAKEGTGIKELLDGIQLLSEVNELKPNEVRENTLGEAFILESNLDKRIGNVALAILKAGDLSDRYYGVNGDQVFKVRAYLDHNQKNINEVHESQPFWITGLKDTLSTGEILYFTQNEDQAKDVQKALIAERKVEEVPVSAETGEEGGLSASESLFAQMLIQREEVKQGIEQKKLNVIVKASTEGTLEAIISKLQTMGSDESTINILDSGTGEVTEDEISRAKLARGIIVSFQLPPSQKIQTAAKTEKVLVRNYEVIYELFDEVQDVLQSMEKPIEEEVEIATAKVKQVFTLSNGDIVAGSEVTKGLFLKGYRVKVMRGDTEVGRGKVSSLRIRKDEVREVKKGLECGIIIDPKVEDLQEGDQVIAFKVEVY